MLSHIDITLDSNKKLARKMSKQVPVIKTRKKILAFVIILLLSVGVYFYISRLHQTSNSNKLANNRCLSELTSLKYQLQVVTDYKKRLDKLLKESQAQQESQKNLYGEMMDSCAVMKQQTILCQHQFEDLQIECKKVKDNYDKVVQELNSLKPTV